MYDIEEYEKHICSKRLNFEFEQRELADLEAEPEDSDIFKIDDDWYMNVEEYHIPISYCPFCGTGLE